MRTAIPLAMSILFVSVFSAVPAHALALGQQDTFEDGTTQGWVVGLLGNVSPVPPVNEPGGGPDGVDDAYLRLTSIAGGGGLSPGSRMTAINVSQWTGDYIAAGIGAIRMDLINLGATDISLRLLFANPQGAPPTDMAVTNQSIFLPAGSGWTTVYFSISPADLTALLGSSAVALSTATELRLFHNPDIGFPGPQGAAMLGVDNITAAASAVIPEPATSLLLATGLCAWLGFKRSRSR